METGNTIMLVEDDPSIRSVLRTLLELEGYKVIPLPQEHEMSNIIQSIRTASPAILFLDVHLHEINGLDLLRELRRQSQPALMPMRIIMSSGMDLKDACLAAGADDFLLKPFMPDELLSKLQG